MAQIVDMWQNNQLDASTIDRFVGAIIEVDYSKEYESQYDTEVVKLCTSS